MKNSALSTEIAMYSDEDQQNYEDWMASLPEELWDVPLSSLAIPGSHDAMSYSLDINSPLIRSESDTFRLLDGIFYCLTRPAIYRWSTTQEKGIVEQLSEGIRYFDLRIAHKPYDPSNELYFTHVIYTHLTVVETLRAVASWLESHSKEVVILACSHFEGLTEKLHEHFIFSLKKIFGSKLCPRKETVVTLRGLWALGYQVLLSYDDQAAARQQVLWPGIPYWWANQNTASGVVSYLDWQKDMGRPGEKIQACALQIHQRNVLCLNRPFFPLKLLTRSKAKYWNNICNVERGEWSEAINSTQSFCLLFCDVIKKML
ncbi:PI-PLC X domain-containing protein 1 isoform X2 [Salmo trutta]|uniref:PI-PLC X domain-containing protein 1 isoform X2 n=1 Tax=Salmo trutta TaxID=8032 RepID=UPI0011309BCB|nr:PI-PLC X domain-containing protein 1-like isoform X2 [Salmo trutta]